MPLVEVVVSVCSTVPLVVLAVVCVVCSHGPRLVVERLDLPGRRRVRCRGVLYASLSCHAGLVPRQSVTTAPAWGVSGVAVVLCPVVVVDAPLTGWVNRPKTR